MKLRYKTCLCLPLLLLQVVPCDAKPRSRRRAAKPKMHQPAVSQGVVQLKVIDAVFDHRKVPIALYQAILQDAKSPRFRASWGYGTPGSDTTGTALYDRERQTLKYWLQDRTGFGTHTWIVLYENVSDEALSAIGKKLEADPNDFDSPDRDYYLERLTQQGSTRKVVQDSRVK